jgi:hypothetical protein
MTRSTVARANDKDKSENPSVLVLFCLKDGTINPVNTELKAAAPINPEYSAMKKYPMAFCGSDGVWEYRREA